MVTFLVTAAVVAVMFLVMVQESGLSTDRTGRIRPCTRFSRLTGRCIRGKLMTAFAAEIFLETSFIFAVTIKRMIVVAFRTVNLV